MHDPTTTTISLRSVRAILLCTLFFFAIPLQAEDSGAAWVVSPPDEPGWARSDVRSESVRIDSRTVLARYSRRVRANVAQSYGKLEGPLPPCVIPEASFLREAVPKVALEAFVPELRLARGLAGSAKLEPGLLAGLVRGTGIDVAAHYISKYLPGEMVASCATARFTRLDDRYYRLKGIGVFARELHEKEWRPCPTLRSRTCVLGESAWVNVPSARDVLLEDQPLFHEYPQLRMEMLYRSDAFSGATFLNWSENSSREGLLVIEYECVAGVGSCLLP